jgi:uncharacterized membrane protein YgdD (TMEM256/DUF423 family)
MRWLAACGSVLAGMAVALAAYASHAASPDARERLALAAAFAFGHGAVLAVLGRDASGRLGRVALSAQFAGTLLFAGSLAGAALAGWPTGLAPFGGMLIIAGWLLLAADRARP